MEDLEPFAFGVLHLTPEALGKFLPAELAKAVDGYNAHQKAEYRRSAWLAAAIINGTTERKTPVSIEDLLPSKQVEKETKESLSESHARILKRFQGVKL